MLRRLIIKGRRWKLPFHRLKRRCRCRPLSAAQVTGGAVLEMTVEVHLPSHVDFPGDGQLTETFHTMRVVRRCDRPSWLAPTEKGFRRTWGKRARPVSPLQLSPRESSKQKAAQCSA